MISIHASEKEATQVARSERMVLQFQSTPPRRRRQLAGIDDEPQFKHFNPRLREGGDDTLEEAREVLGFQSTPPRRRRRMHRAGTKGSNEHFNPRLREGGDQFAVIGSYVIKGFQSTPPRRRRLLHIFKNWNIKRFQSTPPRRRRQKRIVAA